MANILREQNLRILIIHVKTYKQIPQLVTSLSYDDTDVSTYVFIYIVPFVFIK